MTKKQADKLGRIIAKLEAMQHDLQRDDNAEINLAKKTLIGLWQRYDR